MRRAAAAIVLALGCGSPGRAPAPAPPHLLVLLADDMAADDLGAAGNPVVRTPNLDRLAREGVRFANAFTPNPICTPSRAALLTGQTDWTNGCTFFGRPISPRSPHFARTLAEAGYETFYTGKWHNDGRPWDRGFTSGAHHLVPPGCPADRGGHERPEIMDHGGGNRRTVERFSSTLITDAAVDFLERRPSDARPFLMVVSYAAPHDPWTPPEEDVALYPAGSIPLPANFLPRPPGRWFTDWHGRELRDEALMPFPRTPEGVREARRRYYGMITQMDRQIGRLLDVLDRRGLARDTLVVFLADHGISLGAHGFSGKQAMYEECLRLPLVLRHPRLPRGEAVRRELVSLIDVFPTLCDAAGVKVPSAVEGRSLLPLYRGEGAWARDRLFATFTSPAQHRMDVRALRTSRHKYIRHLTTGEEELYDLEGDPHEMRNLADDPGRADLRRSLSEELSAWQSRVNPR